MYEQVGQLVAFLAVWVWCEAGGGMKLVVVWVGGYFKQNSLLVFEKFTFRSNLFLVF